MLNPKFTNISDRVKGVSLHTHKPWVLTALYNGTIELWDYRINLLIQTFTGHEGPVRAIRFHQRLPLVCSGGDDCTVRVWNYKSKGDPFLLKGHLDYIRSVGFHNEFPWVISSSDDQTARIFNYQSRQMIAIMTGHSHYVMCCQFHPDVQQHLIITCSLDKTLKLWSYTNLKTKYAANKKQQDLPISGAEINMIQNITQHSDQINSCVFHPKRNLIASAGDDHLIILWNYKDSKVTQDTVLKGHTGNVNSISFQEDLLISVSEDRTIRIWDLGTKIALLVYVSPENDRYWIVESHPVNHYFAVGSDTRCQVLTLFKDTPPSLLLNNNYLCYGSRKELKIIDIRDQRVSQLKDISDYDVFVSQNKLYDNITQLQYNPYSTNESQLMIKLQTKSKTNSTFIILTLKQSNDQAQPFFINPISQYHKKNFNQVSQQSKLSKSTTSGTLIVIESIGAFTFISRANAVCITSDQQVHLYNLENDISQDLQMSATNILAATGGKVILVSDSELILYEPIGRQVIARTKNELKVVKQCIWNDNLVAVVGKLSIIIYTKSLVKVCEWMECVSVKSALWVGQGILIYSTKVHVKFGLLNGETGLINSTEHIQCLKRVIQSGDTYSVCGMDNRAQYFCSVIDLSECILKQALYERNSTNIRQCMQLERPGQAVIAYLYKKRFPSLAIGMITDKEAKFSMAVDSHNLEEAFTISTQIQSQHCYQELVLESLRQGNHQLLEYSYIQSKQPIQLSFLYALLGQQEKQAQIKQTCSQLPEIRVQCQTYLGDIADRVRLLCEVGQFALAYITALQHGMVEESLEIKEMLRQQNPKNLENAEISALELLKFKPCALVPLTPIIKATSGSQLPLRNWPQNIISADKLVQLQGTDESNKLEQELSRYNQQNNVLIGTTKVKQPIEENKSEDDLPVEDDDQWGIDENIIEEVVNQQDLPQINKIVELDLEYFRTGIKRQKSQVASKKLLENDVQGCIDILKKQIALKSYSPLKEMTQKILRSNQILIPHIPFLNPSFMNIRDINTGSPMQANDELSTIRNLVKQAFKTTTEGKFQETLNLFTTAIGFVPLVQIRKTEEEKELLQIIETSLNYIIAMKCQLAQKKQTGTRLLELGVYMAICNLQPQHRILTLRSAMSLAYKMKNYLTTVQIAKTLLQILATDGSAWAKPEVIQNANKLLQQCEKLGTNEHKINFDERWLSDPKSCQRISASSLTIIEGPSLHSPYLNASYEQSMKGEMCQISGMCTIGQECEGLNFYD